MQTALGYAEVERTGVISEKRPGQRLLVQTHAKSSDGPRSPPSYGLLLQVLQIPRAPSWRKWWRLADDDALLAAVAGTKGKPGLSPLATSFVTHTHTHTSPAAAPHCLCAQVVTLSLNGIYTFQLIINSSKENGLELFG